MQVILKKNIRKKLKPIHLITIRPVFAGKSQAILRVKNRHFICAIGKTGITSQKYEGDGATPLATMSILCGYFQPGLKMRPRTLLPMQSIKAQDGWCDAPQNSNYNRKVKLPYRASAENMARTDGIYDFVLILDWNIKKRSKNRGSAIFMHIARQDYSGTQGCIALSKRDMAVLLPYISRKTKVQIYQ